MRHFLGVTIRDGQKLTRFRLAPADISQKLAKIQKALSGSRKRQAGHKAGNAEQDRARRVAL